MCRAAASLLDVDGVSIRLMTPKNLLVGTVSSDVISARLEELQLRHGTGPGIDAQQQSVAISEPFLERASVSRWPGFARAAVGLGVAAVFAFPLRVADIYLGALDAYRGTPGPLSERAHRDGELVGEAVAMLAVELQESSLNGTLVPDLDAFDLNLVVHQASGMVAAQLSIDVSEALVRLRGHAIGEGRSVTKVSEDVVSRLLRFDELD